MKRKLLSFNALFLSGTLIFVLSLIPNRSEAQTLTTIFSDNFDATSETLATNSWFNWGGSISLITSPTSNSGTHCAQFNGGANASCYLRKTVSVTAGKTYIYSAYSSGGKSHALGYQSTALGDHAGSANTNSAWAQHSVTFKATTTENLTIYVYQWGTGTVWVDDVLLQQQQWTIAAASNNVSYGSVSGTTGLTDPGTSVSLTAAPLSGYYFVNWTEGGTQVSTSATYNFTASADRNLVANFAAVSAASITVTGTLSPFSSTYGTVSAEQNFSVAGSTLTSDIVVTPPAGFEVSLTSGSGFGSSVTLPQLSGTVAATPVFVRFSATALAVTYSAANIGIVTAGTSNSESCSGTVAKKELSITGSSIAAKTYNGNTASGTIHVGTITGFVGTETVTATGSCTLLSPNVWGETATIVYTLVNGTNGGLASNYSLANTTYWEAVTQKQLDIKAGNQTVTYGTDAAAVEAAGTYTTIGVVGTDNLGLTGTATYTTTYTNTTAVGTTGVTITNTTGLSITNSNYWVNKTTGTITIIKATPTVTVSPVGTYIYNGSAQGPNAATTGGSTGAVTYSYAGTGTTTYAASVTQPTEVGSYSVTATVAADANYNEASSSATAFTIDVPTAVNKVSLSNIQILTNNKKLLINAPTPISSVSVYDAFGRVMVRQLPMNNSVSIDLQCTGIYIVETKLENGELSRNKFIIR
ncbi:MAG: hypothetical protein WCG93_11935 [Paludibacter sp.]